MIGMRLLAMSSRWSRTSTRRMSRKRRVRADLEEQTFLQRRGRRRRAGRAFARRVRACPQLPRRVTQFIIESGDFRQGNGAEDLVFAFRIDRGVFVRFLFLPGTILLDLESRAEVAGAVDESANVASELALGVARFHLAELFGQVILERLRAGRPCSPWRRACGRLPPPSPRG